jgi:hypothetical protein
LFNTEGFPLLKPENSSTYGVSIAGKAEEMLKNRSFVLSYGTGNNNVWDFMSAVCQHSYLLSYKLVPQTAEPTVTLKQLTEINPVEVQEIMVAALCDAVDATAKIWLRVWKRYLEWKAE